MQEEEGSKSKKHVMIGVCLAVAIFAIGGGVWWWMSSHANQPPTVEQVPMQASHDSAPVPATTTVPAPVTAAAPAPVTSALVAVPVAPPATVELTQKPKVEGPSRNQDRDKAIMRKTNKTLDDLLK